MAKTTTQESSDIRIVEDTALCSSPGSGKSPFRLSGGSLIFQNARVIDLGDQRKNCQPVTAQVEVEKPSIAGFIS